MVKTRKSVTRIVGLIVLGVGIGVLFAILGLDLRRSDVKELPRHSTTFFGESNQMEYRVYVEEGDLKSVTTMDHSLVSPINKIEAEKIAKSYLEMLVKNKLAPNVEFTHATHFRYLDGERTLPYWQIVFEKGRTTILPIIVLMDGTVLPVHMWLKTRNPV